MPKHHKYDRLEKIIGEEQLNDLSKKTVLVLGCGGVGGYSIEALSRSNIGTLILVDFDKIEETNINRQIIALDSTIGLLKTDAFEARIKDINKEIKVIKISEFIDDKNIDLLFQEPIDYLIDACDTMLTKKLIIKECIKRLLLISNKYISSKLDIIDIKKTVNDPLARMIRKFLKEEKINKKVMVLSSTELPVKTHDRTPGSTAFVPSSAGLLIASYVVRELLKEK